MQIAQTVLMVRPAAFGYNAETAATNHFQQSPLESNEALQQLALKEFDDMVASLRKEGIDVIVIDDTVDPPKPDAIFPNNWFCANNRLLSVFPLCAASRRAEKRDDILEQLRSRYEVDDVLDWSEYEAESQYLEGTGSMVIDHQSRIIYACLSPRTHKYLLARFGAAIGYRVMPFDAHDSSGRAIYHTNVMMSIGEGFAVLCPKAITDHMERIAVAQLLEATGHENIYIEPEQMEAFAGNLLQLRNKEGARFIVLSETAHRALTEAQRERLAAHGKLLPFSVPTIERVEGGSVRCMMAEILIEPRDERQ
jgi:hypothetical protein